MQEVIDNLIDELLPSDTAPDYVKHICLAHRSALSDIVRDCLSEAFKTNPQLLKRAKDVLGI